MTPSSIPHVDCIIMLCGTPYIYVYYLPFFCQNKIVIIQCVIPHKYCSYTYTRLFNIVSTFSCYAIVSSVIYDYITLL